MPQYNPQPFLEKTRAVPVGSPGPGPPPIPPKGGEQMGLLWTGGMCPCLPHSGDHHQGEGGGGGASGGEGGHHHQRVDGLLSLLRVDAQYRALRPGQVAGEAHSGVGAADASQGPSAVC